MNRLPTVELPDIDRDHDALFECLSRLREALRAGNAAEVASTLAFAKQYAHDHFGREEEVMLACAYPRYREHRAAHGALWRDLATLEAQTADAAGASVADGLLALLTRWFEEHVIERDQELQRYVAARAALERRAAGAGPSRALRFLAR